MESQVHINKEEQYNFKECELRYFEMIQIFYIIVKYGAIYPKVSISCGTTITQLEESS